MPSVQKAHELFQDKDVAILVISIDGKGERAVAPLMTTHGYTFPSLVDQRMEVARKFGMRLVPTTYVLNQKGRSSGRGMARLISLVRSLSSSWKRCCPRHDAAVNSAPRSRAGPCRHREPVVRPEGGKYAP